jgi:hypothetical protein
MSWSLLRTGALLTLGPIQQRRICYLCSVWIKYTEKRIWQQSKLIYFSVQVTSFVSLFLDFISCSSLKFDCNIRCIFFKHMVLVYKCTGIYCFIYQCCHLLRLCSVNHKRMKYDCAGLVEQYWQEPQKNLERNLLHCHFAHYKFPMDCHGIELRPLQWEASNKPTWLIRQQFIQ